MQSIIKDKLIDFYNKRLESFLGLCESEIEKLFLLNFIYYWELQFSFNHDGLVYQYDAPYEYKETRPILANGVRLGNSPNSVKMIFGLDEEIILTPQYEVKLQNKKYRLDFLLEIKSKNKPTVKVCIECDGYDYHYKNVQKVNTDNERTGQLMKNGFYVVRLTGSQINAIKTYDEFKKLMDDILILEIEPSARMDYLMRNRTRYL
jgi:very-short-patch-repair endonuclease